MVFDSLSVSYREPLFSYLFLKNLPKFLQKQLRRTRKLPMFLPADV